MVIRSLLDIIGEFDRLGRREAVRYVGPVARRRYSYADVSRRVAGFAASLHDLGVGPGSRVVFWSENRPEWVFAYWAVQALGAVPVPVDAAFSASLVRRLVKAAEAKLVLFGRQTGPVSGILSVPLYQLPDSAGAAPQRQVVEPGQPAQILFTSGTTGEPKGVVHTHRLLAQSLQPFADEFARYRWLAAPFQPIRILCLVPLSHVFGQAMGLLLPPLLGGSVVFTPETNPRRIAELLRRERVTVLAAVPKWLANFREFLTRHPAYRESAVKHRGWLGVAERWWRYRQLHRMLGWKFWAVVTGGAAVPAELEEFFGKIGILLIQGYSLTEAGPIVAVNHPFRSRRRSLGTPLPGREVQVTPNGELMVRVNEPVQVLTEAGIQRIDRDGWMATGDLVARDAEGRLYFHGRRKEVIVTAEGLNVYPEDLEPLLLRQPGVRDAAVIPWATADGEVPAAVLVLEPGAEPGKIVATVNRGLEVHQRIKQWFVWPESELPRTPSTGKLQRTAVRERLLRAREETPEEPGPKQEESVAELASAILEGKLLHRVPDARLDEELGLGSLDRVRLMISLEQALGRDLDEEEFAGVRTLGDLHELVARVGAGQDAGTRRQPPAVRMPRWTLAVPARLVRWAVRELIVVPLARGLLPLEVQGVEALERDDCDRLLFAANHQSLLDVIVILAALPRRWRSTIAPAMVLERFPGKFRPAECRLFERLRDRVEYFLACLLFAAFPLPQRSSGLREVLAFLGELLDRGYNPLIFPEGERSHTEELLPLRPGVVILARELEIPIQVVRLRGVGRVLPVGAAWPRRHPVSVRFGARLQLPPGEAVEETLQRLSREFARLAEG
ncbi:MAG: AMP-binding protein [Acidobacteriota bacterium]